MFITLKEIEDKYNINFSDDININEQQKEILNIFNNKNELFEQYTHIELFNYNLCYIIGLYYKNIKKDYELMKKYYLMAIEKGNSNTMNYLGVYYKNIEKDYDLMKQYYLMVIEKENSDAMNNLNNY